MVVNLNFNLEAWVKSLSVTAESEEAAVDQLRSMTLADIIKSGATVDTDVKFTEIETSIESYDLDVKVTNIKWDLDPEIMDYSVIEYLKNFLPSELKLTIEEVSEDANVEDIVKDAIFYETDYDAESFDFEILKKK